MAVVELTTTLPVLLLIGLVSADYARMFDRLSTLSDGARAVAVHYASNLSATADDLPQITLLLNSPPSSAVTTVRLYSDSTGSYVEVTITDEYESLVGLPLPSGKVPMSRRLVMMRNPI